MMKTYKLTINGEPFEVTVNSIEGTTANVTVNGTPYQVDLEDLPAERPDSPAERPDGPSETTDRHSRACSDRHSRACPGNLPPAPAVSHDASVIPSPLPGVIIEINVKEGQTVHAGEKIAVLEAMKMENEITAPRDGIVTAIHVSKGDSILEGAPVVTLS